jgi:hypothetical protein
MATSRPWNEVSALRFASADVPGMRSTSHMETMCSKTRSPMTRMCDWNSSGVAGGAGGFSRFAMLIAFAVPLAEDGLGRVFLVVEDFVATRAAGLGAGFLVEGVRAVVVRAAEALGTAFRATVDFPVFAALATGFLELAGFGRGFVFVAMSCPRGSWEPFPVVGAQPDLSEAEVNRTQL